MIRTHFRVNVVGNAQFRAIALCVMLVAATSLVQAGTWRVQVTAVHELALAEQLEEQLQRAGHEHVGIHWRNSSYKVWVGAEETRSVAEELQLQLVQQGFTDAFLLQAGPRTSGEMFEPPVITEQRYVIQVYSLTDRVNAERAAEKTHIDTGYDASIVTGDGLFRVRIGPFESRDAAEFARQVIVGRGYADTFLVPFEE